MSPSGWLECGAIVLHGAIKPPPGQTRASLFLYGAQEGNKERSHWDTEGPPFVWCPFCSSSMPGLGRGGFCWSLALLISPQSLVWPKWRCELNWLEWPQSTVWQITWRTYREGIVHLKVFLAAPSVLKVLRPLRSSLMKPRRILYNLISAGKCVNNNTVDNSIVETFWTRSRWFIHSLLQIPSIPSSTRNCPSCHIPVLMKSPMPRSHVRQLTTNNYIIELNREFIEWPSASE